MAKIYLEKLSGLVDRLKIEGEANYSVEVKHLFTGAAFYVNGIICVSWSPGGLAFKLAPDEVKKILSTKEAKPLKYFPKGHVKKEYAMFESPELKNSSYWRAYFEKAITQAVSGENSK